MPLINRDDTAEAVQSASANHFGLTAAWANQSPRSQVLLPQSGFRACAQQELRIKFDRFLAECRAQRAFNSNYDRIVACPGHVRIVGMGQDALPFIMEGLEKEASDPFFSALELTTSSPSSMRIAGIMRR